MHKSYFKKIARPILRKVSSFEDGQTIRGIDVSLRPTTATTATRHVEKIFCK